MFATYSLATLLPLASGYVLSAPTQPAAAVPSPTQPAAVPFRGGPVIAQVIDSADAEQTTWQTWQTTANGKYKFVDEKVGTGEEPERGSVVSLHYTVSLTSGMELGSTRGRWPLTFAPDKHAVPIFCDAIEGMRIGGRRRLVVPSRMVPPSQRNNVPRDQEGEALRFEIELLGTETGLAAVIPSMLPPGSRRITITRALFALSFLPYLLPDDLKPDIYKAGDVEAIRAAREATEASMWHGVPIDSLWP